MNKNKSPEEIPAWVLWFANRGFTFFMVLLLAVVMAIAAVARWLDSRLDNLEGKAPGKPPKSYTPPDLDAFAKPEPLAEGEGKSLSLYVPVYSHLYFGGGRPILLETTLSVRNISPTDRSHVQKIGYYDTDGELVAELLERPIVLGPLQTLKFVIPQRDSSGGSGANFLVDWVDSDGSVEPLVEAVMIGNVGTQGISLRAVGVGAGAAD